MPKDFNSFGKYVPVTDPAKCVPMQFGGATAVESPPYSPGDEVWAWKLSERGTVVECERRVSVLGRLEFVVDVRFPNGVLPMKPVGLAPYYPGIDGTVVEVGAGDRL